MTILQKYHQEAVRGSHIIETMKSDPNRHGGVWGPWDWTPNTVTYQTIGEMQPSSRHHDKMKAPQLNTPKSHGFWGAFSGWLAMLGY